MESFLKLFLKSHFLSLSQHYCLSSFEVVSLLLRVTFEPDVKHAQMWD